MLECRRVPDLDSRLSASYNPRPKRQYLRDELALARRSLELAHLLPSLVYPDTILRVVAPCCQRVVLEVGNRSDILRRLWSRDEDQVQSFAQVVRLQRSPDRSGNVESGLSSRIDGERDIRW